MPLFQRAPSTEQDIERGRPLDIPPDRVLEFDDDQWYAQVYRGDDVSQLTVRAVLVGTSSASCSRSRTRTSA